MQSSTTARSTPASPGYAGFGIMAFGF